LILSPASVDVIGETGEEKKTVTEVGR